MTTHEIIAERREQVAALTHAGRTGPQIADVLGVTERTVQRDRSALGLVHREQPQPLTAEQLRAAAALLDDGAPYIEAARTVGCCYATLAHHFPGRGWTQHQSAQLGAWRRRNRVTQ